MQADLDTFQAGLGPNRERLLAHVNACWTTQAIGTAVTLGLAERLAGAAMSADDLAAAAECHAPSLRRLMRALASLDVVEEGPDGRWSLTATGRLLLPDEPGSVHTWAGLRVTHWQAWGGLAESVRTGRSHRERHAGRSDFAHLDADPALARRFHRAMAELTGRIAPALVDALALRGDEYVLDVGGSEGEALVALARPHPCVRGAIVDQAHARPAALARLEVEGLRDRCGFVTGDFFAGLPSDADLLLLKSVLHNWDDAGCERLLRNCRTAMGRPRARLAIVERVVPARLSTSHRDQELAGSDLNMLVHLGGRERTLDEISALLASAGLRITATHELPAAFTLVEACAYRLPRVAFRGGSVLNEQPGSSRCEHQQTATLGPSLPDAAAALADQVVAVLRGRPVAELALRRVHPERRFA